MKTIILTFLAGFLVFGLIASASTSSSSSTAPAAVVQPVNKNVDQGAALAPRAGTPSQAAVTSSCGGTCNPATCGCNPSQCSSSSCGG